MLTQTNPKGECLVLVSLARPLSAPESAIRPVGTLSPSLPAPGHAPPLFTILQLGSLAETRLWTLLGFLVWPPVIPSRWPTPGFPSCPPAWGHFRLSLLVFPPLGEKSSKVTAGRPRRVCLKLVYPVGILRFSNSPRSIIYRFVR